MFMTKNIYGKCY